MIARAVKRLQPGREQRHAARESLRQRVVDESLSYDERWQAMLFASCRDSARTRQRNLCALTSRPEVANRVWARIPSRVIITRKRRVVKAS